MYSMSHHRAKEVPPCWTRSSISESTLSPILRRLEQGGALSSYRVEHNGRLRKFYHLTPQGWRQLQDFSESREELDRIFDFIQGSVADDKA